MTRTNHGGSSRKFRIQGVNISILVEARRRNSLNLNSRSLLIGLMDSSGTIISSLVHGWNLFALHKSVNDPLKTLLALNHFDDELSFNGFVVLDNVWLKLLVTTSNLSDNIIGLLLKMNLVDSNQIERVFDMNDWNSDVELINQLLDL